MQIHFATTNESKVKSLQRDLSHHGIEIVHNRIELIVNEMIASYWNCSIPLKNANTTLERVEKSILKPNLIAIFSDCKIMPPIPICPGGRIIKNNSGSNQIPGNQLRKKCDRKKTNQKYKCSVNYEKTEGNF